MAVDVFATMGNLNTLAARVTAVESGKADLSVTSNLASRCAALESWRAAKVSSPDVPTTVSVPTAVITLGLNAPTVAGINALGTMIMTEINSMKAALRTREIFA